jgi:hypothetical protein
MGRACQSISDTWVGPDRSAGLAHVGTNEDGIPTEGLNVPSLVGVARAAPYLHDGTAASLTDRATLGKSADRHGITSTLSPGEVADLVEYLQTL